MPMPMFPPDDDPGSSFPDLLRRLGTGAIEVRGDISSAGGVPARDDVCRPPLRRRRRDGGGPAGDGGEPDQSPGDGQGGRGRSAERRRHRRRGRAGDGHGAAVPTAARALREGRGRRPQPGGQGQPAVDDDPRQPAGGDDGPRRRADLRRLRRAPDAGAVVGVRHHRRALRGARVRGHRLGQPARRHRGQARLPRWARPGGSRRPRLPGAVGSRRRRLGHRRSRRAARDLPDRRHDHRRTASPASTTTSCVSAIRPSPNSSAPSRPPRLRDTGSRSAQ